MQLSFVKLYLQEKDKDEKKEKKEKDKAEKEKEKQEKDKEKKEKVEKEQKKTEEEVKPKWRKKILAPVKQSEQNELGLTVCKSCTNSYDIFRNTGL